MYTSNLTPRQREILATWAVKGPAREKAQAALAVTPEEIALLHAAGYLKTLPTDGVYLADGGILVLGPKMKDRLAQVLALLGCGAYVPSAPSAPRPAPVAKRQSAPNAPKAPRSKTPPELAPVFYRNPETEAWARAKYEEALAKHRAGETYTITAGIGAGMVVRVPAPQPPVIGADCARWRRALLKGETAFKRAQGPRPISYGRKLRARTVTDIRIETHPDALHEWQRTERIGRIFHPHPVVDCPTCHKPIALATWWCHGCEQALVDRVQVLGDFHELTDGAAVPEYEGERVAA